MTAQEQMREKLAQLGIPYRTINCYGSQIVVTSLCRNTAEKWALTLAQFATFKGIRESIDYIQENRNTIMNPSTVRVWRTYAVVS